MRKLLYAIAIIINLALQSNFARAQNAGCTVYSITVGCYVYPQGLLLIPQTLGNGQATAPSLAWQSAPTTGFFLNGTTLAGIDASINGSLVGELNSTGLNFSIGGTTPYAGTFTILTANSEFRQPTWTTVTRPTSPTVGEQGYNTTLGTVEVWNGSAWLQVSIGNASQVHGAFALTWGSPVTVTAGTYIMMASWPWTTGTINSIVGLVGASGQSFVVQLQINGTNVTNCSSVTVSSTTATTTTCSGSNVITSGQELTAIISSVTGSPNISAAQINYVHSEP